MASDREVRVLVLGEIIVVASRNSCPPSEPEIE
jgi:hypothetical protein